MYIKYKGIKETNNKKVKKEIIYSIIFSIVFIALVVLCIVTGKINDKNKNSSVSSIIEGYTFNSEECREYIVDELYDMYSIEIGDSVGVTGLLCNYTRSSLELGCINTDENKGFTVRVKGISEKSIEMNELYKGEKIRIKGIITAKDEKEKKITIEINGRIEEVDKLK